MLLIVGQIKRKLNARIKEHRNDINRKNDSPSVISRHRMEASREFNWGNVRVLDEGFLC